MNFINQESDGKQVEPNFFGVGVVLMFQTERSKWWSVQKWFNFNLCSLNAESFPFDVYDQDKNLILEFLGPQNQSWGPKQKFGQE